MTVSHQAPFPKIEIISPDGNVKAVLCEPGGAPNALTILQSYSFTEDTASIPGSFTFTITAEVNNKDSLFDALRPMDIVKIYEGGKEPVFIGSLHPKRLSGSMTERGPRKSVSFSGESIAGLISRFMLAMDLKIMNTADADQAQGALTRKLATSKDRMTIKNFLKLTWEAFTNIEIGGVIIKNIKVLELINKYMGNEFFETVEKDPAFLFDIVNTFYTQGINEITQIWQSMLPQPAYEIFSRCNESGEPKIVARETPFDSSDWKLLEKHIVGPSRLLNYDLQQSDDEVYTFFYAYLVGSSLSHDQYLTISTTDSAAGDSTMRATNRQDKLDLYGYRPLQVSFHGYDASKNKDVKNNSSIFTRFGSLNDRLKNWFDRLDEMFTGSITIITDFNDRSNNPRIGNRLQIFGGEFYIKGTAHSWSYGSIPTITLTVSRGAMYDENGNMKGQIEGLSKTLSEVNE